MGLKVLLFLSFVRDNNLALLNCGKVHKLELVGGFTKTLFLWRGSVALQLERFIDFVNGRVHFAFGKMEAWPF